MLAMNSQRPTKRGRGWNGGKKKMTLAGDTSFCIFFRPIVRREGGTALQRARQGGGGTVLRGGGERKRCVAPKQRQGERQKQNGGVLGKRGKMKGRRLGDAFSLPKPAHSRTLPREYEFAKTQEREEEEHWGLTNASPAGYQKASFFKLETHLQGPLGGWGAATIHGQPPDLETTQAQRGGKNNRDSTRGLLQGGIPCQSLGFFSG